ncbi:MAG: biotin--[acetyl-CoA-carboxylase] ligase [Chitinophagaceae bacterium]|nr:biotin--[acetyl-CoA-carboxylase] ligase [Chitinophagaceae bacterium]
MLLQDFDNKIGNPFIEFTQIDSTNNYAMEAARNHKAKHGAAFFAHEQTGGKGMRGHKWSGESGKNIALSVLLQPDWLPVSEQFQLSAMVAVAVQDFLSNYIPEPKIKWPNDIYLNNKKATGILIENILKGNEWQWAVAGIGININQTTFPPEIAGKAISLKQLTGKDYDTVLLAKELCQYLEKWFKILQNDGFPEILKTYNSVLFRRNEYVKFSNGEKTFLLKVLGVNEKGLLMSDSKEFPLLSHGEMEWMV